MSKSRDYADLKQDLDNAAFTGLYSDLDGLPTIPTNVSQLTNDSGYITTSAAAPVDSVNGQTGVVSLSFNDLSDVTTSAAGTNKFLTKTGSTYLFTGLEYSDLSGTPSIPSNTSDLTNDSNYTTTSYVDTSIANLVASSPASLDTLNELAAALGDDANFSTTVTDSIATKASQTDMTAVEADVSTLQSEMVTRTSFDTLMLTAVNGNTSNNATNAGKISTLEAKTHLTDFTNDISEVTSTVPTSGAGKPAGYVWYII